MKLLQCVCTLNCVLYWNSYFDLYHYIYVQVSSLLREYAHVQNGNSISDTNWTYHGSTHINI